MRTVIFDCGTGKTSEADLSAEGEAQLAADAQTAADRVAAEEAAASARAAREAAIDELLAAKPDLDAMLKQFREKTVADPVTGKRPSA